MVTQILVGLFVGFAIGVPATFWLLNKARIKSKLRYVQVSLALGLPTAFFIFLSQTNFAVPIFAFAVTLSGLVLSLELTLRRIVQNSNTHKPLIEMGPNGSQVSFEQSRIDSGSYPYDYLTEDIWAEMGVFLRQRALQSKPSSVSKKVAAMADGISVKKLRGYEIYQYVSVRGPNFSITNGIRNTTDVNETMCVNKVFIFGGSTTFCD